jgi:signal recognition particle receptor subunit beta
MALINHIKREINAKIVYYGREGVGKRVALQYLYDRIKPSLRGELKTAPASGDTLLFFDFSPFEQPQFGGYRIRFHMYCLTGKVTNPAAWKMTLKGADGLVVVADDSPEAVPAARASVSDLRGFLAAYGVSLHDIPCVLQLNRLGRTARSPGAVIAAELDLPDLRTCFSDGGSGEGVLEALSLISRDIMARIGQDDGLREGGRTSLPSAVTDENEPLSHAQLGPEDGSFKPEAVSAGAEVLSLSVVGWNEKEDSGRLRVALAGEGADYSEGAVRIPLEITLGGESRRLVVTVAIELA